MRRPRRTPAPHVCTVQYSVQCTVYSVHLVQWCMVSSGETAALWAVSTMRAWWTVTPVTPPSLWTSPPRTRRRRPRPGSRTSSSPRRGRGGTVPACWATAASTSCSSFPSLRTFSRPRLRSPVAGRSAQPSLVILITVIFPRWAQTALICSKTPSPKTFLWKLSWVVSSLKVVKAWAPLCSRPAASHKRRKIHRKSWSI